MSSESDGEITDNALCISQSNFDGFSENFIFCFLTLRQQLLHDLRAGFGDVAEAMHRALVGVGEFFVIHA